MKTLRLILHSALITATVILLCFHYSSAQNSFPTPTGACELDQTGAGAGSGGELRLLELNANGNNYVGWKAPDIIPANVLWTLPNADGGNGTVLTTNGSGTLTWAKRVNTDLSNLKAVTAVNSSLVPGVDNTLDLGSPTFAWRNGYFKGNVGIGTSTPSTKLQITGGGDVSLAGLGFMQLGSTTSANVVFDDNEIMARSNGAASTLFLQNDAGDLNIGAGGLFVSNLDARVGINTTAPDNTLHVVKGSAVATGNTNAPLVVENSTTCFMNLLAPDANERGVLFGDNLNNADGGIIYNAAISLNGLDFRTNGNISRMTLSSAGELSVDAAVIIGPTNGVINCGGATNSLINVIGDFVNAGTLNVNGDEDLYIDDDLQVHSAAFKPGGGSWSVESDARLKKDIRPYQDGLSTIMKIDPVWFRYNDKMNLRKEDAAKEFVGVIAQDMIDVAPYTIDKSLLNRVSHEDAQGNEVVDNPGEEYYVFDPSALTFMLVNAVKEQNKQIAEKESKINNQQQQIDAQQVQIKKLAEQLTALEAVVSQPVSTDGTARFAMTTENAQPVLGQNIPNPFDNSTLIPFRLPKNCKDASLRITETTTGSILRVIPLVCGETQISIEAGQLSSGNYTYTLYVDGNLIDTKQMVLTK